MTATHLIQRLIEEEVASVEELIEQAILADGLIGSLLSEASVHLPRRGKIWVAHYTGLQPGQQVWRSTGQTDFTQALALAKEWERQAKAQRMAQGTASRKPTLRVRHLGTEGSPGLLTQREVAVLLGMSERGVREVERRALKKLLDHPVLRQAWDQYRAGELGEELKRLTMDEEAALLGLVRTVTELYVMRKVLRILARWALDYPS